MDIVLNTIFNNPNLPVVVLPGFYDNFEGNPSTASLGRTSREARMWEYPGGEGWWRTTRGTASGYQKPGSRLAIAEGYSADGRLAAVLAKVPTTDLRCGVAFRVTNVSTFLYAAFGVSGITLYSASPQATTSLGSAEVTMSVGSVLEAEFIGDQITIRLNGVIVITATTADNLSSTMHGLFNWNTTTGASSDAEWDSIEFTAA